MSLFRQIFIAAYLGAVVSFCSQSSAQEPLTVEGESSREVRMHAIRALPLQMLNSVAAENIRDVVENPSYFRRMPSQEIECDPQMFAFLVRRPEVMVNIWDMMGITKVSAKRTSPFSFIADDGVGTKCRCDLVYGDNNLYIYYGSGDYDGSMMPRKLKGRCVCVLHTRASQDAVGRDTVAGTMDVFLKLDNFGADLLTRSVGPFVGKTADYNFVETAKFISQVSQICVANPAAAQGLAMQLTKVDSTVRQEFAALAAQIASQRQPTIEAFRAAAAYPQDHLTPSAGAGADAATPQLDFNDSGVLEVPKLASLRSFLLSADASTRNAKPSDDAPSEGVTSVEATSPRSSPALELNSSTSQTDSIQESAKQSAKEAILGPPSAIMPRKPNVYMRR